MLRFVLFLGNLAAPLSGKFLVSKMAKALEPGDPRNECPEETRRLYSGMWLCKCTLGFCGCNNPAHLYNHPFQRCDGYQNFPDPDIPEMFNVPGTQTCEEFCASIVHL